MSVDQMFSRRQVLRYGIAAMATTGGSVAAFAQESPGSVPRPSPQDVLKWAADQAERGAGRPFPDSIRKGYMRERFFPAFEQRLKSEVTVEDLIVLGGLSHQWGALSAQNAALDGSDEILVRHCKAATVFMQGSEAFQRICAKVAPPRGRWCEEIP